MNEKSTGADAGGADEPGLTQKNSETVRGEEELSEETGTEGRHTGGGAHPKIRAIPSSYGAPGGLADTVGGEGDQRLNEDTEE